MSTITMTRREQLLDELKDLFLSLRNCLASNFDDATLSEQGIDSCEFDLIEATARGGTYFRPMSQKRLDALNERPDMYKIPFWPDQGHPCIADAYMVHDAINDQLRCSRDEESLWKAYESTQWEPVGWCKWEEQYLEEASSDTNSEGPDPTRQTTWSIVDVFATKDGLPHRSCIACHEIWDVTGPTRSELMILTGLMIVRMYSKAYRKHEVFPVLMLSIYGSKARILQAHMSPENQRLQVRYSQFCNFRNLSQEWLDIIVRWFLNDPLAEPSSQSEWNHSELHKDPKDGESLHHLTYSQTAVPEADQNPDAAKSPHKGKAVPGSCWSPRCDLESSTLHQRGSVSQTVLSAC